MREQFQKENDVAKLKKPNYYAFNTFKTVKQSEFLFERLGLLIMKKKIFIVETIHLIL